MHDIQFILYSFTYFSMFMHIMSFTKILNFIIYGISLCALVVKRQRRQKTWMCSKLMMNDENKSTVRYNMKQKHTRTIPKWRNYTRYTKVWWLCCVVVVLNGSDCFLSSVTDVMYVCTSTLTITMYENELIVETELVRTAQYVWFLQQPCKD